MVTMVVNDIKYSLGKSSKKKSKERGDGDDGDLYDLVRGKRSSMMIQRLDEEGDDFVPRRGIIMMISSDESEDAEYSPKRGIKEKIENEEKPLDEDQDGESETTDSESSQEENESSGNKNENKKYESSSVSPPASRSVPGPILRRNYPEKGTVPNQPSEGWHVVYAQQQRRQK